MREVLGSKRFRQLFAVRLSGQFCDGLFQASLGTFVLFSPERQADATSIAMVFALIYLPYSIIGPFAGVFLDRWRRRQVLLYANLLRALVVIGVAWITTTGNSGIGLGLAVLLALGINRFILAGLSASLPHTVDRSVLVTANAYSPTTGTIFAAVGGVLGVVFMRGIGGGDVASTVLIIVAAIGFAISGLLALVIPANLLGPDDSEPRDSFASVVRGLVGGSQELWRAPTAFRAVTVTTIHRAMLGASILISVLLLRNTLNSPNDADAALAQLTLIVGTAAAGALIGAVLTPLVVKRISFIWWTSALFVVGGIVTWVGLMIHSYASLIIASFAIGMIGQVVKICADTAVQREIADEFRGRVFTLYDVAVNIGIVVGVVAVSLTVPTSGISTLAYVAIGVILVGTGVWYSRHASEPSSPLGSQHD